MSSLNNNIVVKSIHYLSLIPDRTGFTNRLKRYTLSQLGTQLIINIVSLCRMKFKFVRELETELIEKYNGILNCVENPRKE